MRRSAGGNRLPKLAVFARFPTPGAAKTRLIPALGATGAAALHRRLVEDTLAVVRMSGLDFALHITGADAEAFITWLGEVPLVAQGEGDLGARLARVRCPCLLIGTDCPDLTPDHLREAAALVAAGTPCIGPAEDGGYWLLGLPRPRPDLFEDMAWGTDSVFAATHARLPEAVLLPMLADLDRPEDLARWPGLA
ncbi:hypothetical protein GCM10007973_13680 [Polymorphobacter multimanifer]|uniref:Glycosyltransferase n=1 Tax=Polymorphobacter multimanifer TaxID=1070431 RepID=A0A841L2H9_9SPHN|nr:TIGR04282 family arsenosugar biosynthesis glycosyltransferase [Polymorphobacter multimanifer]MBB6227019.1 hypothetical protein [Polymorphobacter multimanifer]GGI78226.1 hypothetical protein GCM10007973_13680 [Polymorphobacter multimanifer]